MCELGLGGCLADDMGLGKTVQVIALHLQRGAGPTLVVCPASLLGNWEREVRRFAPGLPVRRYHGGGSHLDDIAEEEVVGKRDAEGVVRGEIASQSDCVGEPARILLCDDVHALRHSCTPGGGEHRLVQVILAPR